MVAEKPYIQKTNGYDGKTIEHLIQKISVDEAKFNTFLINH